MFKVHGEGLIWRTPQLNLHDKLRNSPPGIKIMLKRPLQQLHFWLEHGVFAKTCANRLKLDNCHEIGYRLIQNVLWIDMVSEKNIFSLYDFLHFLRQNLHREYTLLIGIEKFLSTAWLLPLNFSLMYLVPKNIALSQIGRGKPAS